MDDISISYEDAVELAEFIFYFLEKEFSTVFLTKNLIHSINIIKDGEKVTIEIPAEMYDMKKFFNSGVIVPTNKGSYANLLNENGSYWGNHKNYVDNAISKGISMWMQEKGYRGKIDKNGNKKG